MKFRLRRSNGKLNFTVSPWRTTSLCPTQLHFCVSKNFTKQKKRANGLKTVNSLYYLSQVSHLFSKRIGLCPYPYFISPIRTSRNPVCLRFSFVKILSSASILALLIIFARTVFSVAVPVLIASLGMRAKRISFAASE